MLLTAMLAAAGAAVAWMVLLWFVSLPTRDASIVDVGWGPGFLVVTIAVIAVEGAWGRPEARLVLALVLVWGLRLAAHLAVRNVRTGEDPRYAAWRAEHGAGWWLRSLFQVFLLQAGVMVVVSLVLVDPIAGGASPGPVARVGAAVVLAGVVVESVADAQLARFRRGSDPGGRVLDTGLWRYSRHPNYFGESVVWWGFWLVAIGTGGAWWTIVSPLLVTWLLLRVSGVPLLERRMASTRPQYAAYARRTSAFIPWPPRR